MLLRVRHWIEYILLRTGLLVLDHLPLPAANRLVCGLARLFYACALSRRRVAVANILRAGLTNDRHEATRMARQSFEHFGVLVLESLRSDQVFSEANWRDKVKVDIAPDIMRLLEAPGQGVLLLSAHVGNWEIAAQLISYLKPVVGITSNMNNPYTDKLMKQRKPRNRFTLTPKRNAQPGHLLAVLKEGNVLALLADQHARKGGMMIDFFGTPASTHTSPAMLHLTTKAPLVFGTCIRTGPMQYTLHATGPIKHQPTGNRKADVRAILERLARETEAVIRAHPEQYLWAHRRWRHAGVSAEASAKAGGQSPELRGL